MCGKVHPKEHFDINRCQILTVRTYSSTSRTKMFGIFSNIVAKGYLWSQLSSTQKIILKIAVVRCRELEFCKSTLNKKCFNYCLRIFCVA